MDTYPGSNVQSIDLSGDALTVRLEGKIIFEPEKGSGSENRSYSGVFLTSTRTSTEKWPEGV